MVFKRFTLNGWGYCLSEYAKGISSETRLTILGLAYFTRNSNEIYVPDIEVGDEDGPDSQRTYLPVTRESVEQRQLRNVL